MSAQSQAVQLLDQLKALQRTDGSIEYAFDVKTGGASAQVRAGAMAWVGYPALAYKKVYDSTKYDTMIAGVARYLLTLRNAQGLIKGGPDVNWVSTQHNLLAAGFLRDLASKLGTRGTLGSGLSYTEINNAANNLGNAILGNLLVQEGALAYFRQGVGDPKIPRPTCRRSAPCTCRPAATAARRRSRHTCSSASTSRPGRRPASARCPASVPTPVRAPRT